jgi:Reverse transcriptase (RNA-dependent DNA polymerase)
LAAQLNHQFLMALKWNDVADNLRNGQLQVMMNLVEQHTDLYNNMVKWMHPMVLAMQANASDNPTWDQAMNGPDAEDYMKAAKKEIETLVNDKDAWDVVTREDWMNVLPSTWAFKCKRQPDGLVKKYKARFCAGGHCQVENVDYFETFAPVVNWTTTVCLMLVLSIILGLATQQLDYTAFCFCPSAH